MNYKSEIVKIITERLKQIKNQDIHPTMMFMYADIGDEMTSYINYIGCTNGEIDIYHAYHLLINLYRFNDISFVEDRFRRIQNLERSKEDEDNFKSMIIDSLQEYLKDINSGKLTSSMMTISLIEFNNGIMNELTNTVHMDYMDLYLHHHSLLTMHIDEQDERTLN